MPPCLSLIAAISIHLHPNPSCLLPPHHGGAKFVFMQTCTSAFHLLRSFPVSGRVTDLRTWGGFRLPAWVKLPPSSESLLPRTLYSSIVLILCHHQRHLPLSGHPRHHSQHNVCGLLETLISIKGCILVLCEVLFSSRLSGLIYIHVGMSKAFQMLESLKCEFPHLFSIE